MDNPEFYEAVARDEVDLWANGWFPLHEPLLNARDGAERVGTQVASGALQGYFADISTVEKHGIGGLADLADPELAGCASDPCATGWPPNDIAAVAGSAFLQANPPVRTLLEQVRIPLEDILAQNAAMISGEGDPEDITRHAAAWIAANAKAVTGWLQAADPDAEPLDVRDDLDADVADAAVLTVATRVLSPFVTYEDRSFSGFEVELARMIAHDMGARVTFVSADVVAKQIDEVTRG